MAALSTISLIGGLALGAAGTGVQAYGAIQAHEAQEKSIAAQKRAEAARQTQMQLESARKRRELVRQGIIARSQATAQATAQGAQHGSALPGALGGISSTAGAGIQGVNQAESIGNTLFASNLDQLEASRQMAEGQTLGMLGGGLSSLGGQLTKNLGPIGRLTYGI